MCGGGGVQIAKIGSIPFLKTWPGSNAWVKRQNEIAILQSSFWYECALFCFKSGCWKILWWEVVERNCFVLVGFWYGVSCLVVFVRAWIPPRREAVPFQGVLFPRHLPTVSTFFAQFLVPFSGMYQSIQFDPDVVGFPNASNLNWNRPY